MTFGSPRVDASIAKELLFAVQPMAIESAMEAEQMHMQTLNEQRRVVELEVAQARYEATIAERRYAACDPYNRLIAAQLEKSWESTLRRVEACQARLECARLRSKALLLRTSSCSSSCSIWRRTFSLFVPKSMCCSFSTSNTKRSISLARELRVAAYASCCVLK